MTDNIAYYKDIIFFDGKFYTDKKNLKTVSLHNRMNIPYIPSDINLLGKLSNIEEYDKNIIFIDGFDRNMCHLLWDTMYPSWYGLFYNNEEDYNIDFQWMCNNNMYDEYGNGWPQDILEIFSGNKITTPKLFSSVNKNPIKIPLLIVGCRNIGINCVNNNFCAGREFKNHLNDPIECFVNRIYLRYKIERKSFINGNYDSNLPINIIYVQNKRPYNNIDKLFEELGNKYINRCIFKVIDWSKYNFEEQLKILNSTGIIICGVGTARGNTPFLPNGAIEIQTNTHSLTLPNNINYVDYHIGTLSKYIKVMHINEYTLDEARDKLCSRYLKEYINNAISSFPNYNKVNIEDNIPLFILNIIPKINNNIFKIWRESYSSNDFGDLLKIMMK